jgi:pimeloyl-ACP methyl ester carboxylesterase
MAPGLDDRSRWIDLDGPVHYLDLGGPADAPVIVCVHGLSGSAVNWSALAPLLTDRYRLLAPDLAGHGLTRSLGRGTTVTANRALLHRFVQAVPGTPVILMGNSMGGLISLLEAAEAPGSVTALVLIAPVLPFVPARPDPGVTAALMALATPGLGQLLMLRRRRMSPEALVRGTLSLCCVDPSGIPAAIVNEHVAVARQRAGFDGVNRDLAAATRSALTRAGAGFGLPYRRLIRSVTAPVLLLHGERDRLVPVAAARAAARHNPGWSVRLLPGVGHVPQLEAPQTVASAVRDWLDARPSGAGHG